MSDERGSIGTPLLLFLAGAGVGAAIVALTTPKSGRELRNDLKDLSNKFKHHVSRLRAHEEGRIED
jgi:gas vesicle protein